MGREDQTEEREVLDSIFPDEITDVSENEYHISITLDLPPDDTAPESEKDLPSPTILLYVRYPEDYPDSAPILDLRSPENSESHPHFSVADDKDVLLAALQTTIDENLGMAMIFAVASTLREEAEQLVVSRREAREAAAEELRREAERKENAKFHGTPVTPASFVKWREGFLKEMEEERIREEEEREKEMKKGRIKEPAKLTGKQLWERGLAGKVDEEGEDGEGVVEGVEKLKVEA